MLFSPKMKIPQNGVSQVYHEQPEIVVAIPQLYHSLDIQE